MVYTEGRYAAHLWGEEGSQCRGWGPEGGGIKGGRLERSHTECSHHSLSKNLKASAAKISHSSLSLAHQGHDCLIRRSRLAIPSFSHVLEGLKVSFGRQHQAFSLSGLTRKATWNLFLSFLSLAYEGGQQRARRSTWKGAGRKKKPSSSLSLFGGRRQHLSFPQNLISIDLYREYFEILFKWKRIFPSY